MIRRIVSGSGTAQDISGWRWILIEPVQQLPERQRRDDVAVLAVALFGDETAGSVLGVDGPFGVVLDEALLPDDLIKRQTHDSFPYPTRKDP